MGKAPPLEWVHERDHSCIRFSSDAGQRKLADFSAGAEAGTPVNSRELLAHYLAGDDAAATSLFQRYVARLTALARSRIGQRLQRRIDPEDVVQSAYRSFFLHAQTGDYEVAEAGDLWRLLAAITLHKLHRQVERHTAGKRNLEREANSSLLAAEALTPEPTAAEVVALCEGLEQAINDLAYDERAALGGLLAGRSVEDLAAVLGKTDRTARRVVVRLREKLEQRLLGDALQGSPQRSELADIHAPLRYEDYLLEQLLGAGGMGKVFRARERATGRAVAVKALHKARQRDARAVALFAQEAQILARLDHPAIVRVHGLGRFPSGGYFLAMDLVEGIDLQSQLGRGLAPQEALRIAIEIGEAVRHAHERGVIHCDLKPANVLLARTGRVFVSDFGFAHLVAQASTTRLLLGGTLGYVAPELLRGEKPTPAADIYSFGVLLAAMLVARAEAPGSSPPAGESPAEVAMLGKRCSAHAAEQRPASMNAIVAELRRLPLRR